VLIYRVELTKEKLAAMPAEERRALLLLGHAINEINVLQKLIMMHRRTPAPHKVVDRLEAGQALILTRVLIGKLHEAWELFKVCVQPSALLRSKYLNNQEAERRALLEKLNKHFGGRSPLTAIRNQLSFHYTDKTNLVEENFQHLSDSEPWDFYLAETVGNSFYWAAELVTTASMVRLATPGARGQPEDFGRLFDLAKEVAGDIVELFQQIVADVVDAMDVQAEGVEVGAPAKLSELTLPFLFDEDDLRTRSAIGGTASPT
jgi:hypothetical protein